ncbi:MAG: hypothetical protein JWP44_1575 [Mucilaginibacter sp.]|nr:hypothetical protein [Mucilaginibacter sp.]
MNKQGNDTVKSNEGNIKPGGENTLLKNPEKEASGLPDINAENFDDQGDIEGMQLGMATHREADSMNTEQQTLSSDHDKVSK